MRVDQAVHEPCPYATKSNGPVTGGAVLLFHRICQLSGVLALASVHDSAEAMLCGGLAPFINGGLPLQSRNAPGRRVCIAPIVVVACELRLKYLLKNKGRQLFRGS